MALADVEAAVGFVVDTEKNVASGVQGLADLAHAKLYEHSVSAVFAGQGAAPQWAQQLLQGINGLQASLHQLERRSAITFNSSFATPQVAAEVVRFLNGDDPTQAPHNLPPLHNRAAVVGLQAASARAYCVGYGINVANNATAAFCAPLLTRHIGIRYG